MLKSSIRFIITRCKYFLFYIVNIFYFTCTVYPSFSSYVDLQMSSIRGFPNRYRRVESSSYKGNGNTSISVCND